MLAQTGRASIAGAPGGLRFCSRDFVLEREAVQACASISSALMVSGFLGHRIETSHIKVASVRVKSFTNRRDASALGRPGRRECQPAVDHYRLRGEEGGFGPQQEGHGGSDFVELR